MNSLGFRVGPDETFWQTSWEKTSKSLWRKCSTHAKRIRYNLSVELLSHMSIYAKKMGKWGTNLKVVGRSYKILLPKIGFGNFFFFNVSKNRQVSVVFMGLNAEQIFVASPNPYSSMKWIWETQGTMMSFQKNWKRLIICLILCHTYLWTGVRGGDYNCLRPWNGNRHHCIW